MLAITNALIFLRIPMEITGNRSSKNKYKGDAMFMKSISTSKNKTIIKLEATRDHSRIFALGRAFNLRAS
jgi:hypothetical protein